MIRRKDQKDSEVSLASYRLRDAFKDGFDVAVVISNGSDLIAPIWMVTQESGKAVGLICPASRVTPP